MEYPKGRGCSKALFLQSAVRTASNAAVVVLVCQFRDAVVKKTAPGRVSLDSRETILIIRGCSLHAQDVRDGLAGNNMNQQIEAMDSGSYSA